MAIPGAPTDSPNPLGDLLANVNRPQLNAFVATSQARNGLVSAQTQEALIKASQAQEEMTARGDLKNALMAQGAKDSDAQLISDVMIGLHGSGESALKTWGQAQLAFSQDPALQTRGQQAFEGHIAGPVTTPGNYQMPPGSPLANVPVQQSPQAVAQTAASNALAGLNTAKTNNPAAFRGSGYPPMTPEQQQQLTKLTGAGIIGPSQLSAFARNPSLIQAISDAYDQDPTGLAGLAHAKQQQLAQFTGTNSPMVRLNTAIAHMGLVPGTTQALNNGDYKFLNKVYQGFQAQTGASAPALADQLAQFLGREVVNAIQANGGGEREREAAQALYERSQAPGVLLDIANQGAQLLAGRAGALEQDYIGLQSMGQPGTEEQYRRQFRLRFMSPDARRVTGMGVVGEQPGSAVALPGNAPHPAGANALPAGLTLVN